MDRPLRVTGYGAAAYVQVSALVFRKRPLPARKAKKFATSARHPTSPFRLNQRRGIRSGRWICHDRSPLECGHATSGSWGARQAIADVRSCIGGPSRLRDHSPLPRELTKSATRPQGFYLGEEFSGRRGARFQRLAPCRFGASAAGWRSARARTMRKPLRLSISALHKSSSARTRSCCCAGSCACLARPWPLPYTKIWRACARCCLGPKCRPWET